MLSPAGIPTSEAIKRSSTTLNKLFELIDEAGFPPGVINLVNGSRDVSDALLKAKT